MIPAGKPATAQAPAILVVDDEDMIREVLREVLPCLGFTVLDAAVAREGLRICGARAEEIQLVILDLVMPAVSGIEMLAALRAQGGAAARIPVLLSSAFPFEEVADVLAKDPRTRFLAKPYTLWQLGEKIGECLALGDGSPQVVVTPR